MKSIVVIVVFASCLAGFKGSNHAGELLRYDPVRQALAVDPYLDGWGGNLDIDFNADHSWASVIAQTTRTAVDGELTLPGIYNVFVGTTPGGGSWTVTRYGWGELLGTSAPALNYSSFIRTIFTGEAGPDQFHYFTDEWNVGAGKTLLYVRPLDVVSGLDVPVQWGDLENLYFRIGSGPWTKYTDVYEEQLPLAASILINPNTLNLKSKGKWITVFITLPEGYRASEIDIATVRLSLQTARTFAGLQEERLVYTAGPSEILVASTRTLLMVKFDRSMVSELLDPGEATLEVRGSLTDKRTFQGSDSIQVK